MPFVCANGIDQHYRLDGPEDAPWLVLSNSLGTELSMWDAAMPMLASRFRVLRYDTRGHGASGRDDATVPDLATLGGDLLGLLQALDLRRAHICGLSMGGLIAQWLAIHAPERIDRLILANTSARIGEAAAWHERARRVRAEGMAWLVDSAPSRWFSPAFRARAPGTVAAAQASLARSDPEGYADACIAIAGADLRDRLGDILAPTLCLAGRCDPVATSAEADAMAAAIAGAARVDLPVWHLSPIEAPEIFAAAVIAFLSPDPSRAAHVHEDERYARGLGVRRAVLGDAHVDRSLAALNPHNREFQDLITRYAWGEIWTRPGLPRHTRSLITIAMLIALNREGELRLHLSAARNNGVDRGQLREVLLQSAIYCGVPAANAALHLAEQVFAEHDAHPPDR